MGYRYFDDQRLWDLTVEVFTRNGYSRSDCEDIANVLLASDRMGIESHGVQRMKLYTHSLEIGRIKRGAKSEIVRETPVSAVIDAHDAIGQPVSVAAMQMAIDKAKKAGVGIVVVRDSNHYGIAGYYAKMACDQGLIGMAFTNSEAIVVPTFGKKAMLGTNPIAISMPAEPYPFFFDASTSVVTRGKFEMYRKAEKPIPDCWGLDANGHPCTNAAEVLTNIDKKAGGGIMPLGGAEELTGSHKGYGYAMLCEIFCSILSMGLTSNHSIQNGKGGTCHGFIAIDPAAFGDAEAIKQHLSDFLTELRESPKADGKEHIYTHGEKEILATADRMKNGLDVDVKTLAEMKDLSEYVGADFNSYFGDIYNG